MIGLIKDRHIEDIIDDHKFECKDISSLPTIKGPIQATRIPMPYQDDFVRICSIKRKLILALDTGLGKTLSCLFRLKTLNVNSFIIVGINAVDSSWRTAVREVYGIETTLYNGDPPDVKKLDKQFAKEPLPKFLFCTYETIQKLLPIIPNNYYEYIIMDEAHLVSHEESKRYQAVKGLIDKHPEAGVIAITGTPIQDKPRDLWGIVSLLNPKLAGSFESWTDRYEKVVQSFTHKYPLKTKSGNFIYDKETGKQKWGQIEIPLVVETRNLDDLSNKLKSLMFRVDAAKYVKYKSSIEIKPIDIDHRQRRVYESIKEELLVELSNRSLKIQNAAVRMLRLLQAAEGLFNIDDTMESSKLDYLVDYLSNTEEKVVVWSRFQAITNILAEKFKDRAVVYNGDVSKKAKMLNKWAFNGVYDEVDLRYYHELQKKTKDERFAPAQAQFFFGVIDLRSSAGIDLHRTCFNQIFSSFSFMHAANYQAAARLLRLGQESPEVRTTYLVADNTIEYKALTHVLSKYETVLQILDGKEAVSFKTNQELIKLLKAA